jgi:hypothetical protein
MKTDKFGICLLCGVEENLTVHHTLWPRKKWINHPLREELKVLICRECHDAIHDYWKINNADETRFNKETKRLSA